MQLSVLHSCSGPTSFTWRAMILNVAVLIHLLGHLCVSTASASDVVVCSVTLQSPDHKLNLADQLSTHCPPHALFHSSRVAQAEKPPICQLQERTCSHIRAPRCQTAAHAAAPPIRAALPSASCAVRAARLLGTCGPPLVPLQVARN